MSDITSIAASGLRASEKRVAVAASNIVNAQSPDYKPKEVILTTLSDGSVLSRVADRTSAPTIIPKLNNTDDNKLSDNTSKVDTLPNVNIDEEVFNSEVASYDFKATTVLLKTQRELNKTLLDIQA